MELLTGSDIAIRYDHETRKYTAYVQVGYTHKEAQSDDPIKALGLAVMLQAGYTENKLKKELGGSKPGL